MDKAPGSYVVRHGSYRTYPGGGPFRRGMSNTLPIGKRRHGSDAPNRGFSISFTGRLVRQKMKKLAESIRRRSPRQLKVTMPLPPRAFVRASTNYWTQYGAKNQLTREEMETMSIKRSMQICKYVETTPLGFRKSRQWPGSTMSKRILSPPLT